MRFSFEQDGKQGCWLYTTCAFTFRWCVALQALITSLFLHCTALSALHWQEREGKTARCKVQQDIHTAFPSVFLYFFVVFLLLLYFCISIMASSRVKKSESEVRSWARHVGTSFPSSQKPDRRSYRSKAHMGPASYRQGQSSSVWASTIPSFSPSGLLHTCR